ncbi:MAG TPA: copper-binding protein [Terriglobales bacterium]
MKIIASTLAMLLMTTILSSCNKQHHQAAVQTAKRYHLKGKVVSIDQQGKMANIDAQAIPGFMGAMMMPYPVKPPDALNKLSPGDTIAADVVDGGDSYWLENVVVTGHSPPAGGSER